MSAAHTPTPASPRPRPASRPRIVIAGLGLLTPLGHAAWPTFRALLAGRTLGDRAATFAEADLPIDPVNLVRAIGGVSIVQHSPVDPSVELADRAAREAVFAVNIDTHGLPTYLGTSKGAVHAITRSAHHCFASAAAAAPDQSRVGSWPDVLAPVALGPHAYIDHHLRQRLGVVPQAHTVAACASALTALDRARRVLLTSSAPRRALVVTAEAALLPQFVHSYRRLGVLAPLTPDAYRQRPLDGDHRRRGFMLTEAGAAVLLERLPANVDPAPGQIELLDTATAGEAHDLVRTDPAMPALRHVAERLLTGRAVDMIHPHAPGTPDHDPNELATYRDALATVNHEGLPDLYACKGALGHSLGASGLVSLVLACLCLHAGQRPPMPWLDAPLPGVRPDACPCSRTGVHAVFAAGFGGHVAGAVIRRH